MLTSKVNNTIKKYSMLSPGDRVLVAVSGGPDSVCLLFLLKELAGQKQLSLHIAHLDHMFRGKQSEEEARFVSRLAEKLQIPASVEKSDVPAYCRDRGLSAQEGAREIRYAFLRRIAAHVKASRIATGHTASDQAETFLLRMIRGAGARGLSSIPPVRDTIVRPLIEITRDEVLDYLRRNRIEYVLDPSNAKPVYTRNRIRHELVPLLGRFNPRITETLAAEADLLRDEDAALESHIESILPGVLTQEEEGILLQRGAFHLLMPAFRRRVIRKAVQAAGKDAEDLSSVRIDEVIAFLADAQTGRSMQLGPDLAIERVYEKFLLRPLRTEQNYSYEMAVPGTTTIPELHVQAETVICEAVGGATSDCYGESSGENYFWQAVFDYDKIGPKLQVRNRLPGDRFCPAGMGGKSKKLQDFFVDVKVPRTKRDKVPLLVSAGDIVWVAGFRTDERFLPGPNTGKVLVVRFRNSHAE